MSEIEQQTNYEEENLRIVADGIANIAQLHVEATREYDPSGVWSSAATDVAVRAAELALQYAEKITGVSVDYNTLSQIVDEDCKNNSAETLAS